jgi:DNA-binding Lrp family transcriptional regulator
MLRMGDQVILPLPPQLDQTDKNIIYELEQDSRQSLGAIAKKVRLSKQTLHYRIQRLVKEGVIAGFITALDLAKLGYSNYEVWIQLSELNLKKKQHFLDFLIQNPNIRWVSSCGGKFDIAIAIVAENLVQFNSIFRGIQRQFPDYVKNYYVSISYELHGYHRTHLLKKEKERKTTFLGGEPNRIDLDQADLKMLNLLAKDSRIETIELAKKAGVAPNTVRAKIKRLEKVGVIQAYTILMQPSKMRIQNYELLVNLHNLTEKKEKEIESFCKINPYVLFLLKVVGKWDLDINFDSHSNEQFQSFLIEFRSRFADIIKDFEIVQILKFHKFDYYPMGKT